MKPCLSDANESTPEVAPLAGAWIETFVKANKGLIVGRSLPSRERGLKQALIRREALDVDGRSPRGSVD